MTFLTHYGILHMCSGHKVPQHKTSTRGFYMVKLNDVDLEKMVVMMADMLQEGSLSAARFDNKEILWIDSAESFLLLNFSNNMFKVADKIYHLIHHISDEAIVECAENVGIIEIDEDGNITFTDDEEN